MRAKMPLQLTRFIGREREIGEVRRLLAETRLLTLTGAAGAGKTRLAIAVAAQVQEMYAGETVWVDLVSITDESLLAQAVARAVDLKEQPGRPVTETVVGFLGDKQLLLILDNCEHLRTACRQLVTTLLAATGISILTTSREPLRVTGERLYPVPSLSLPPRNYHGDDPAGIGQFEAIQLFVERAQAILPNFVLTPENADTISAVCRRLDGLPLAIEMAAARVNVLTVEQIAARLDNQFGLLAPAAHISHSPHETLRAAIDWSYDLLTVREQLLLQRLSVFAGGCSLTMAEMVCAGEGIECEDVLDLLAALVNKSLVVAVTQQLGEARYALLETIRQYAAGKLRDSGEGPAIRDRHLRYFLTLVEETEPRLKGEYQQLWLNRLDDAYDNIRAAMSWSLESGPTELDEKIEAGLRIATALYQFWTIRDYREEGLRWYERLLARAHDGIDPVVRLNALLYASLMAGFHGHITRQIAYADEAVALGDAAGREDKQALASALAAQAFAVRKAGDAKTAFKLARRAIELVRALGDPYELGLSLTIYSFLAMSVGKYDEAQAMLDEGLPLLREVGNPYRIAMALNNQGDLARCKQNYAAAEAAYDESIALLREIEADRDLASVLHNQGHASLHLGEVERARALFRESMAIHREQQNAMGMAECLLGFAALAIADRAPAAGARLLAAAEAIGGEQVTSEWAATRLAYEHYRQRARQKLTEARFWEEQAAGHRLGLEEAVAFALEAAAKGAAAAAAGRKLDELTPRQREVALLVARAKSNDEIAEELVVSKRTVETHVSHILGKLGFESRTQIVRWALESRLIRSGE